MEMEMEMDIEMQMQMERYETCRNDLRPRLGYFEIFHPMTAMVDVKLNQESLT